ncbi:MAG TPA: hypothetical protein VGJ03_10095 [Acidimicrobiales bacterium]|jgi:hypothetical protein
MSEGDANRTVNLNLGNAAELNMVVINAAHIAYVKLTGSMNSGQRRMEINLANGGVISMNFDEHDHAERVFAQVIDTINRTIPDHLAGTPIVVPQ